MYAISLLCFIKHIIGNTEKKEKKDKLVKIKHIGLMLHVSFMFSMFCSLFGMLRIFFYAKFNKDIFLLLNKKIKDYSPSKMPYDFNK